MQPRMEIRWFIEGEIPIKTKDWFHQGRTEQAEIREDWYLSLPNITDVGIKIRGGETEDGKMPLSKIEVKKRILDQGMQTLADGSAGQVEQWFKWSFKAADQKDIMKEMTQSDGQWIRVGKERWLRKYVVNEDGSVQFVSPGTTVAQGCGLELTGIQVVGKAWHSLGFEAFGAIEAIERNLWKVIEKVMQEGGFPPMQPSDSCSYALWLSKMIANGN